MTAEAAAMFGIAFTTTMVSTAGTLAVRGEVHARGQRGLRATLRLLTEVWTAPSGVVGPAEALDPR